MTRVDFWDLIAKQSAEKEQGMDIFTSQDQFAAKTLQQIGDHLGTSKSALVALKNGTRGTSVPVTKKAAQGTTMKAGNIYLVSQLRALEGKLATKAIAPENTLAAVMPIMKAVKGSFRSDEIERDAEFVAAAERLREIAEAALESFGPGEYSEPVTDLNSGVTAVAAKSTRDMHGRKIPEGQPVERDGYGRRI